MEPQSTSAPIVQLRTVGASVLLVAALMALPACASGWRPATDAACGPGGGAVGRGAEAGERAALHARAAVGSEQPTETHAFYDGASGRRSDLEGFLRLAERASLIAFGELHGDPVGSATELRLLESLVGQDRPVALALEFFESDTQADLDAYLSGRTTEEEFLRSTRRDGNYARTHRPLIELCKRHAIPVIAANAPRRLVSAYREYKQTYAEFLAGLEERERSYLPTATTVLEDRHRERFVQLMGPERGALFFKSMSLWDDAMAESIARFQKVHPDHRVLLVVGAFHVTERLGTITKYLARVPEASARVLLMSYGQGAGLAFEEGDKGAGDFLLKVRSASPRSPSE